MAHIKESQDRSRLSMLSSVNKLVLGFRERRSQGFWIRFRKHFFSFHKVRSSFPVIFLGLWSTKVTGHFLGFVEHRGYQNGIILESLQIAECFSI
jgi:hypothetical protein